MVGGDPEVGRKVAGVVWGTVKGGWEAYNAPEGEKWEAFKKGYDEGSKNENIKIIGGTIAK